MTHMTHSDALFRDPVEIVETDLSRAFGARIGKCVKVRQVRHCVSVVRDRCSLPQHCLSRLVSQPSETDGEAQQAEALSSCQAARLKTDQLCKGECAHGERGSDQPVRWLGRKGSAHQHQAADRSHRVKPNEQVHLVTRCCGGAERLPSQTAGSRLFRPPNPMSFLFRFEKMDRHIGIFSYVQVKLLCRSKLSACEIFAAGVA